MSGEERFDVFLSYTAADEPWVKRLKAALVSRGLRVWLACDEILPGDPFPSAIERAIAASGAVALVVSPESIASGWVGEESLLSGKVLCAGRQTPCYQEN